MPISYLKELSDLKISKNKKIKSHVSKNNKRPISNLKETPFPPTNMCRVNAVEIVIYYQRYLCRDNFVKAPPKCPTNRL